MYKLTFIEECERQADPDFTSPTLPSLSTLSVYNVIDAAQISDRKVVHESASCIHKRQVSYSSEIELPEITHITYITLDTFEETTENKNDDLSAWLSLLIKRDADSVTKLVEAHPEFVEISI